MATSTQTLNVEFLADLSVEEESVIQGGGGYSYGNKGKDKEKKEKDNKKKKEYDYFGCDH